MKGRLDVMSMKNVPVAFNIEDPEQLALYEFLKKLPNGKKRNASAFIKMLVDREYQRQKHEGSMKMPSNGNVGIKLDFTQKGRGGLSS